MKNLPSVWVSCAVSHFHLSDFYEFDIEHEDSCRVASWWVFTISHFGWNPEAARFAFDHELQSFGPSCNDAVERKAGGLATLNGRVEEFAIGGPAGVMHGDKVGGFGVFRAGSTAKNFGSKARSGDLGISWGGGNVGRSFKHGLVVPVNQPTWQG